MYYTTLIYIYIYICTHITLSDVVAYWPGPGMPLSFGFTPRNSVKGVWVILSISINIVFV